MPTKRAKHSARVAQRETTGFNLAPSSSKGMNDIPRSARFLFSGPPPKREKQDKDKEAMRIRPNERLSDFNQRVESAFSSDINATMRRENRSESNTKKRARRRELLKAKKRKVDPEQAHEEAAADWKRAAASRSLHDVAQAPPTLTVRPKERKKPLMAVEAQAAARPKPSLARQRILDEERTRAVQQYRALKKDGAQKEEM